LEEDEHEKRDDAPEVVVDAHEDSAEAAAASNNPNISPRCEQI